MIQLIIQAIIRFFAPRNIHYTGVNPDPRSNTEKNQDYLHSERDTAGTPVDPFSFPKLTDTPYFKENQYQTDSCIAHSTVLAAAIEIEAFKGIYNRLSPMFVYRQRSNYPDEGMWLQGALQFFIKTGSCLFSTLPTPKTEAEGNRLTITRNMVDEANIYNGLGDYTFEYYKPDPKNITELASIAAQGIPVPISIYATYFEWAREYPLVMEKVNFTTAPVRHCVTIVPNSGFTEAGKKYVVIQDSAPFGGFHIRYLSEDFIKARAYDAGYLLLVKLAANTTPKPIHTFVNNLSLGNKNDEVKCLQEVLVYEGLLPADCVTGLFAGRTLAAVKAFQNKYASDILIPSGLTQPTGYVGSATIKKLNELYAK